MTDMATKTIVLRVEGMDEVTVERDIAYGEGARVLDVYRAKEKNAPVVIFAFGFAHPMFARGFRTMGAYTSWARLLAASGMTTVAYAYEDPTRDVDAVFTHVRAHADALGVDANRTGILALSGNVPRALRAMTTHDVRCAALVYGYMLDVAPEIATRFGIVTADAFPPSTATLVVRAGRDETPGLLASQDAFVRDALERNHPLTLVNHRELPHAFDLMVDSEASRGAIAGVVDWLRTQLRVVSGANHGI